MAVSSPTSRDEFWRYSGIESYLRLKHPAADQQVVDSLQDLPNEVLKVFQGFEERLVIYNGQMIPSLSTDLAAACVSKSKQESLSSKDYLDQESEQNISETTVLRPTASLGSKLLVLFIYGNSTSGPTVPRRYFPRHKVVVSADLELELFEFHMALNDIEYSINHQIQIELKPHSTLHRTLATWFSDLSFSFIRENIEVQEQAVLNEAIFNFGGRWGRYETLSRLTAPGAEYNQLSHALLGGESQWDLTSGILHLVPETKSSQLAKNIVCDRAQVSFNGRILIDKDAQKSQTSQLNQNLVLGDKAQVNSRPQLEVYADDVKASHGSTIGQVNSSEIFYLRSRGIDEALAEKLVSEGFASDVVDRMTKATSQVAVRQLLQSAFQRNLNHESSS